MRREGKTMMILLVALALVAAAGAFWLGWTVVAVVQCVRAALRDAEF